MNKARLQKLLDELYEVHELDRDYFKVELLEALLEKEYDPDLGKTNFSEQKL